MVGEHGRNLRVRAPAAILGVIAAHALALAGPPPREDGPNGHRLVQVPAGAYALGEKDHPLNPPHTAKLQAFLIADAETTNAQFAAFVQATGYVSDAERRGFGKTFHPGLPDWVWEDSEGAHWRTPRGTAGPKWEDLRQHPVTQISGADAAAYCHWIGGRLPTLDEWEIAARAGSRSRWPSGRTFRPGSANIWNGPDHAAESPADGSTFTARVRSYAPNDWGLYDVIGNVFEYCADLPAALRGREAALVSGRGGSWWCSAHTCASYNLVDIGRMDRHGSLANQGFRVAFSSLPR